MEKLITIKTLEQLQELKNYIKDNNLLAIDTETTGVQKESRIIGFSVSAHVDIAYYVVLSYWDTATQSLIELETAKEATECFELMVGKDLIMHNAPFDCWMINNNYKVELMPSVHTDTLVLGHLLNENRPNGLKELGVAIFGEDARAEQIAMKESVHKNGGMLTKDHYELYKADADLMARYGAKDTILTIKLFYLFIEELYEQGLENFFYDEESMPLLRGPTYDLNTTGLKVDLERLQNLKGALEAECMELKAFIYKEITPHVKDKYPGTGKTNTFNISAGQQLSWLLFEKLGNEFGRLTDGGKELCEALNLKPPYAPKDKREFIRVCKENKDRVYHEAEFNKKTGKLGRPKKIGDFWKYVTSDKEILSKLAKKYKWVEKLLEYNKNTKLLSTYVVGIQNRVQYGIIRPSFLQHGTTSGRYSSKNPNFQNLPRDDKRVKECIIARPGRVFVGADYSQLEPRVFASVSQDPTLMSCFEKGEDFYSVVGIPIFEKTGYSSFKKGENAFAEKFPELRNVAKAFALATPYGTSAFQQSQKLSKPKEECQYIIDRYFESYPKVELMMLESHEQAKAKGIVHNLYGRPRRIPEAMKIGTLYGKGTPHGELPYSARTLLNLAMNHRVQSSAASIVNRAAIAFHKAAKEFEIDAKIILQVHDELVIECKEEEAEAVAELLRDCMENTVVLPGVKLVADPKIAKNLGDLK